MILAIDVGNTNIVLGGVKDGAEQFSVRIASDCSKTADQYALDLQGILNMHHVDPAEIEGGIISSVVPYLKTTLPQAVKILTGIDILVVGPGMNTGLDIRTDNPKAVGSDLIVGAVAARAKYKLPIAIVDMGTATTVSVIDENGSYRGGMIIPGLWVSLNALSAQAAQLPNIDLTGEAKVLGTNTIDSMRSGSLIGCAAMLDGIIDRVEEELGKPVSAVLTGGVSTLVAPYCKRNFNLEPDILIRGLQLLYDRNKKA